MASLGISGADLGASLGALTDAKTAQSEAALKIKSKAKAAAQEFESMFISNMFQQMSVGIDGDGPFGGSGALKVWRSFLTNQYAKQFEKAGGIGIATHVYNELLKYQGLNPS